MIEFNLNEIYSISKNGVESIECKAHGPDVTLKSLAFNYYWISFMCTGLLVLATIEAWIITFLIILNNWRS